MKGNGSTDFFSVFLELRRRDRFGARIQFWNWFRYSFVLNRNRFSASFWHEAACHFDTKACLIFTREQVSFFDMKARVILTRGHLSLLKLIFKLIRYAFMMNRNRFSMSFWHEDTCYFDTNAHVIIETNFEIVLINIERKSETIDLDIDSVLKTLNFNYFYKSIS